MDKKIASKFRNMFNFVDDINIIENYKSTKVLKDFNFENLTINEKDLVINEDKDGTRRISISEFVSLSDKKLVVTVFDNCVFETLNLNDIPTNIIFQNSIIKELNIKYTFYTEKTKPIIMNSVKIETINIEHATVTSAFKINFDNNDEKTKITKISIKNSTFEKDFSINNSKIDNIEIKDVDFNSLSEFYKVEFKDTFNLSEITYKGFTLFDKCVFNTKANFDYIIFEKFTSFRGSKFHKGLNIDYTTNNDTLNLFDAKELDSKKSKENTSQETYRIIKHNFEKLGNKIEANKYHALELEQKRKELERDKSSDWKDKWVFRFHDWSSNHSTNWFRPLWLSLIIAIITVLFVNIDIAIDLFFKPSLFKLEYVQKIWSEFWQYCYIGNMNDKLKASPLVFLFNKVSLGYLYYQFLMSVRKDTRK